MPRCRARDLGLVVGEYRPGPLNAITDVPGVRVGHVTKIEGAGPLVPGRGPVRTGVTAVYPEQLDEGPFVARLFAGVHVFSGAGDLSGAVQVEDWGLLEGPILLTNTVSVGAVRDAAIRWMIQKHPTMATFHDPITPVVGECDDSYLSDFVGRHVTEEDVFAALDGARPGPVAEGSVGGGTGLNSFDFKAGIGTASRVLPPEAGGYTLGVLIQANFAERERFAVLGVPVGRLIPDLLPADHIEGSSVTVVATDAPLLPPQLRGLARRVPLGLGRLGSYGSFGSGEFVIAFSTANVLRRGVDDWTQPARVLTPSRSRLNPLYRAVIEAVEEAVLNALCAAETMEGRDGNVAHALPLDRFVAALQAHGIAGVHLPGEAPR